MKRTLPPLATLALIALISLISAGCGSNAPSDAGAASGSGSSGSSGAGSAAREKAVKFAECMRDHGVREFPDPDASGEMTIDDVVNGASLDPNAPAWKEAIGACKDLQPPGFTGHQRSAQQQKYALKFAECVREHGVKDFPDPAIGDPLIDTNRIPSAAGSGGMAVLNAAMHECGAIYSAELGLPGS